MSEDFNFSHHFYMIKVIMHARFASLHHFYIVLLFKFCNLFFSKISMTTTTTKQDIGLPKYSNTRDFWYRLVY